MAVCPLLLTTPFATRQPRLSPQCYSVRCCTQAGVKTEAPIVADSVKHVIQSSGRTGTLGNQQALQPPESIIISDSEEDISGHAAADAPPLRSSPPPSIDRPTGNLKRRNCKSAVCTTAHRSSRCELGRPFATQRHKPLLQQSQASDRAFTSNARSLAKAPEQVFATNSMLASVRFA